MCLVLSDVYRHSDIGRIVEILDHTIVEDMSELEDNMNSLMRIKIFMFRIAEEHRLTFIHSGNSFEFYFYRGYQTELQKWFKTYG